MLILEIALGLVLGIVLLNLICIPEFWAFLGLGLLCVVGLGVVVIFWNEILELFQVLGVLFLVFLLLCLLFVVAEAIKDFFAKKKQSPKSPDKKINDPEGFALLCFVLGEKIKDFAKKKQSPKSSDKKVNNQEVE